MGFPLLRRRGGQTRDGQPGKLSPLIASAQRMTLADLKVTKGRGRAKIQDEAWRFYDASGLLRTGVRWKANSMSRATLFIAKGDTDVPEPERVDNGPAVDLLDQLFDGPGGQSQMLAGFGYQLGVPGECYLVGYRDPGSLDPGRLRWCVASSKELSPDGDKWVLDRGDGKKIPLTDDDWVLRIWKSHPQRWFWADSPVMGLLGDLKELEELGKHVIASIDSRLAGAGVLLLPQEMTFPMPANPDQYADPFTGVLYESMVIPLQNRDSASAVVPIVVRVPGATIKDCKHISFSTPLDERIPKMRQDAIQRIALGLDMPPEVLLGMSDANHWGAWQITEEGVKLHIEPELATICDALTTEYLWPQLGGDTDLTIWFDTSELTERPNRGPDAATVFDAGELSGEAFRAHHGFSDTEAPKEDERKARILLDIAKTNPQLALPILEHLQVLPAGKIEIQVQAPLPVEAERTDRTEDVDAEATPATDQDEPPGASALVASAVVDVVDQGCVAACNIAVLRALEVAGKKLLTRDLRREFGDVPAWELHTKIEPSGPGGVDYLLSSAWTSFELGAPEYRRLVPVLDEYVRTLIKKGVKHDARALYEVVAAHLRMEVAGAVA